MNISTFLKLCNTLVEDGGIKPTKQIFVEEQVTSFLHIVGNNLRNSILGFIIIQNQVQVGYFIEF